MKTKLTLEFDENDRFRYLAHVWAELTATTLVDLDSKMRSIAKHSECEISRNLAEEVRQAIREEVEVDRFYE